VPLIKERIGDRRLELHAHCNTGLAPLCAIEAARCGVDIIHTACEPMANGSSHPSAQNLVANLRGAGFDVGVDDEALEEYAAYFRSAAKLRNLPTGTPAQYDISYYEHQVPGGMMGTLRRQLGEMKMEHRLPDVLEEVKTVRRELGYPIMVTPFSQFVGAQAVLNVVAGERYARVPNEIIQYERGVYGTPPAPIDPDVLDRIRAASPGGGNEGEREEPTLSDLRKRFGAGISDEELLLRIVMPREQVDAMVHRTSSARPAASDGAARPIIDLLEGLKRRPEVRSFSVDRPGFSLSMKRSH
jgi:oxaloacetate decarboxylase alpha subunit